MPRLLRGRLSDPLFRYRKLAQIGMFATLVAGGDIAAQAPYAPAPSRRLSINDLMRFEGFGSAAIDPSGRWLVYERLRPYEQSDDYSFRTYAMGKTGHQLWRYDLIKGGPPLLLPGVDPIPHSYLQGFSPSGRRLAVMQYRLGRLSLGAYDMLDHRYTRFDATPAFSKTGEFNPVWSSNDEMIFAALPGQQQPELTSVRAYSGEVLRKAWSEAWSGKVVTASEVRSRSADHSFEQESGSLVQADALTGKTKVLAFGLFADLRLAPDKRSLAGLAVSRPRPSDPTKLAEDDPRRFRLTLFDLKTGRKRSLAVGLEFFPYTITWSPDGGRIAAFGWRANQSPRDGRFYVIEVASGLVTRYDHRGLDLASERERGWLQRPERVTFLGSSLAVFARPIPAGEDHTPRFTHRSYDKQKMLPPAGWYALSADGRVTDLTTGLGGVSGVPVHAGPGTVTITASDGVYRLFANGTRRRLTPSLPGKFRFLPPGTFATNADVNRPEFADEALFSVGGNGPGLARIAVVDLRLGHEDEVRIVDTPAVNATPLAGSLVTGAALFRAEDGPTSTLFLSRAGAAPQEVARINGYLTGVDFGHWERVSYVVRSQSNADQTIVSCVLLPPGASTVSPPPLVVEVYPDAGPQCGSGAPVLDPYSVNWSPYMWASMGYAYARLTTPRTLIQNVRGPIAGMPAMVEAGVDALVARGLADPKRLALVGYSQGGVSALYVAAHTARFRLVIAMNSWADLFSDYFGSSGIFSSVYKKYFGDFGRYDDVAGTDFPIGRTPFEDPDAFFRNSPVFLAPRINAPVMLVHSDMDGFSMYQFDEMYGALTRAGKDVRYVRYWGEGHSPSSPANVRDLWERVGSFLTEAHMEPATKERPAGTPGALKAAARSNVTQ